MTLLQKGQNLKATLPSSGRVALERTAFCSGIILSIGRKKQLPVCDVREAVVVIISKRAAAARRGRDKPAWPAHRRVHGE